MRMLLSKKNRQKRVDAAAIDASHHLTVDETTELEQLRGLAPAWLAAHQVQQPAFGEHLADTVASQVGSWRFLIIQSVVLAGWVIVNLIGWIAG